MHFIFRERDSFDERNHSTSSYINFTPQLGLSSLEDSTMAHMLVQQQPLRTPNMNILPRTPTINRNLLPISHSVDDRLFFLEPNSTSFFDFFDKFASVPNIFKYQTAANNLANKSSPPSPLNQVQEEQEQEVNITDCDTIQPVTLDHIESDTLDTISPVTTTKNLDQDGIVDTTASVIPERHFRRRKRRSSWTPSSCSTIDESKPLQTDSVAKSNDSQKDKSQPITDNSQPISLESLSLEDNSVKTEELNKSPETSITSSRLRSRRLRHRPSRQTVSIPDAICENNVQFFVPTETPAASTASPTPPPSPVSPSNSLTNTLPGGLKRVGSTGATKKMVRFADSVGRQLAQVQYIRSIADDDSKDSLWTKSDLYIPTVLNFEPKPWSFDVAWTSKKLTESHVPKRFFCLYRQPNSEHPDIYLHEVWKSQIKLEHADIRLKLSATGEQYLHGTAWVTNAGYWKNVTVKYSFNRWLNTYEYDAQHRCHSNDFRNIDQFEFNIDIPQDVDRIDFVLRYQVNGQEHWDNNEGKNYTLETESSSIPQTISFPHDCDFNEMRFY
ncbi:unnamed protein product [Adineta ricciae]|uniref:CBM21 domain-containing protein n=1 Tax=Adineta ricciae TaxID=249248 RepID=A0A814J950_ADIRI|nr:unnamed protein product [Adineta ricciae]